MFFKNKHQEAFFQKMEDRLASLEQEIHAGAERLDRLNQAAAQFDSLAQDITQLDGRLNQNIAQLQSAVQKHDMAIEDLLDEWEEKQSDEKNVRDKFRESEQTEKHLLELFEAYQEQLWSLKRFAEKKDAAWSKQIALMEKNLENCLRICGISIIQERGADVDYTLHEVVEAIDTTNPALDKKIADIYKCGYIYKGRVKKKAQAAAYRAVNVAAKA